MISRILRGPAALSLAALAACSTARSDEANDGAEATPVVVRVERVASIVRPVVVTASGVTEARTSVDIAFQVGGKVMAVGPDDGDVVRAGEFLAQLDPTDYRLAVEQTAAVAEHAAAERDRHRPLLATGSVAANDLERMESGARQAAAAAALARKRLDDARLVSPMAGIIARRAVEPGSTVAPGQTVFTVVDLDVVTIRIGVAEADVDLLRVGQSASVRVPALGATTVTGRVTSVGVVSDPTTRTYAIEIAVPNPGHRVRAGMVAEAAVQGRGEARTIAVPASAIVRDADGASLVFLLDSTTNRVHRRRVTVGTVRGEDVEITAGLAAGDMIVVAGQQRVRDGSLVVIADDIGDEEADR